MQFIMKHDHVGGQFVEVNRLNTNLTISHALDIKSTMYVALTH